MLPAKVSMAYALALLLTIVTIAYVLALLLKLMQYFLHSKSLVLSLYLYSPLFQSIIAIQARRGASGYCSIRAD